jgi:hypothetical protein
MTMMVFTIIFTLLAMACVVTFYVDAKIQKHIFVHHPKLWGIFGFPLNSRGLPDTDSSEYNIAECKLAVFLKSPKCVGLGDTELLRLKALNKLAHQIVIFMTFCTLIAGYITFLA